jgi:hypothetical protein
MQRDVIWRYNCDKYFLDVGNGSAVIRSTYEWQSLETSHGLPRWRPRTFHPQGCLHNAWCNRFGLLAQLYNNFISYFEPVPLKLKQKVHVMFWQSQTTGAVIELSPVKSNPVWFTKMLHRQTLSFAWIDSARETWQWHTGITWKVNGSVLGLS